MTLEKKFHIKYSNYEGGGGGGGDKGLLNNSYRE